VNLARFALVLLAVAAQTPSFAAEFVCVASGQRIERSGSTVGGWRAQGSDWRIEKSSSTVGYAKKAGSDWRIETSGASTLGYLKGSRIESSGGSTIGSLSDATSFAAGCPDEVAVALWILKKEGKF
jgi:hypothetical protein